MSIVGSRILICGTGLPELSQRNVRRDPIDDGHRDSGLRPPIVRKLYHGKRGKLKLPVARAQCEGLSFRNLNNCQPPAVTRYALHQFGPPRRFTQEICAHSQGTRRSLQPTKRRGPSLTMIIASGNVCQVPKGGASAEKTRQV